MKIALVFPKSTFLNDPLVWQPLGLFYLGAQLEAQGHLCEFFDLSVDELPNDGDFDQMWVSSTSPQIAEARRIGNIVSTWANTKTVLGGAGAWANPETHKELGFDLVVVGEADHPETIKEILNSKSSFIIAPVNKTLDWVLPPIRRWSLRYHSYMQGYRMTSMFTTRGCPMSCAFCLGENQRVLMANGTYKYIQDVEVGDTVMGLHKGKTAGFYVAPTKVLGVHNQGIKQTIKITSGDSSLRCTPDHKLYVDDGNKTRWKRADSSFAGKTSVRLFPEIKERTDDFKRGWLAGYIAGDKSLPKHSIDSVEDFKDEQVYDLTTDCHSFIVEGFIVHNCESGRHGVIWDSMVRYEPMFIVEEQIKESKALGFQGLAYYDDIFILNKKRTREMLELHRKYDMKFRCFLRSDILIKHGGKEYLKELQDGGLIEIFVGVESADNQIKKNIHKGTTIEQDTLVLQWCKELGITCKMSFILGLPGESMESMEKTADWIFENRPHRVQVDRLIPFPGTPLTKNAQDYDLTYETQPDEEFFFRGRADMDIRSFVSTSHLTVEEIDKFWYQLEIDLKESGLNT